MHDQNMIKRLNLWLNLNYFTVEENLEKLEFNIMR